MTPVPDGPLESLSIGYSVLSSRAHDIVFPPAGAGPEYLVSVQGGGVSLEHAPSQTRVLATPGRVTPGSTAS